MKKRILILIILFFSFEVFSQNEKSNLPKVEKGKIDLSGYSFGKAETLNLDGEWEFYWNQLLEPDSTLWKNSSKNHFNIPEIWNGNTLNSDTLKAYGFATYRLVLKLKQGEWYGMKFPYQATAFKAFINGELAFESGYVSSDLKSIIPSYINKYHYFKCKNSETEIIYQVANNAHKKGGTWSSVSISKKKQMLNTQNYSMFVEIFIAGALFIMAFFHFIQFFNRNNQAALLSFAIFYFIIFARLITTGERVLLLGFPNFPFSIYSRIEYFSFFLSFPAFIFFLDKLFEGLASKKIKIAILIIPAIFTLITLFTDLKFYSNLTIPYQIIGLAFIVYALVLIYKAIKQKHKGAHLILYGTVILILGTINDILFTNQILTNVELTHYSVLIFSIFQAMAVSLSVSEIENKNQTLEAEFNTSKYLSEIGKEITSTLNTKKIFDAVYQHLKEMMSVDILKIGVLRKENKIEYIFSLIEGKQQEIYIENIENRTKLSNWCIKNKENVFINDIENEYFKYLSEREKDELFNSKSESIIYVPLIRSSEIVGFLSIQSYTKNSYTKNHFNIFESIAAYAYIAYMNARSFEQIQHQKRKIETQRDLSLKQEKEITSSINYASRIQHAMLPAENIFSQSFIEHFILFKPRDIVSGDFYWVRKIDELIIIIAADCTGHGVPGAFVSMLGISILNKINIDKEKTKAGDILNELREEVKYSLNQTGKEHELRDGMDLALCMIDTKTKKLQFSGANNHLYVIAENELQSSRFKKLEEDSSVKILTSDKNEKILIEIKADRQPIGIHRKEHSFSSHNFELLKGDKVYMFSDGFVDQFGGKKGHKFRIKYFKELLLEIQGNEMNEQKDILNKTFEDWKGERRQIDDVLVMGLKI